MPADPDGHPWPGDSHRILRGRMRWKLQRVRVGEEFVKLRMKFKFEFSRSIQYWEVMSR